MTVFAVWRFGFFRLGSAAKQTVHSVAAASPLALFRNLNVRTVCLRLRVLRERRISNLGAICLFRRRPFASVLPLMVVATLFTAPLSARADYEVTIDLLFLRGHCTSQTDAGLWLAADGDREHDLAVGQRLRPGDTVRIFYGDLQVYVKDSEGNRFIIECDDCNEPEPMEMVIGDPTSGSPFTQHRGSGSFRIKKVGNGFFEVLIKVLIGPEERTIPVGVRGTVFATDLHEGTYSVSVAKGLVSVGGKGTPAYREVASGRSLVGTEDGVVEIDAAPEVLDRMERRTSQANADALMGVVAKPAGRSGFRKAAPWIVFGLGLAAGATGGAMTWMAYDERRAVRADADAKFKELEETLGFNEADRQADAFYQSEYDERVQPKRITSYVLYGVGGALAVGGVVWALLERPEGPETQSKVTLLPTVDRDACGLLLGTTF